MQDNPSPLPRKSGNPLEYIAFWQFLTFFLLVCVIWVNEFVGLASSLFGDDLGSSSWVGAALVTAAVIIVGFVTIGNTYLQQRRILKGFITVCAYCRRVRMENKAWELIEQYISDRTLAEFTHGVCPDCYKRVLSGEARATKT
jgi:hypothetical protein